MIHRIIYSMVPKTGHDQQETDDDIQARIKMLYIQQARHHQVFLSYELPSAPEGRVEIHSFHVAEVVNNG